ncbi:MAG: protein nirF [Rhodospirillales bacterium]|nr:protein nirF [Rhodospirillales bacterium]
MISRAVAFLIGLALLLPSPAVEAADVLVVERASGAVQIVDAERKTQRARIEGLGDLSHATAVFTPDGSYAFVFGRDGGLSKIDLARGALVGRVIQGGNSIGGVLAKGGKVVAVANYVPGGVKLFDASTLVELAEIPAVWGPNGERSKVVGLMPAPGDRLVFSLWEAGEIWILDIADPRKPAVTRFKDAGSFPYDGNITPDGRHYIAGLFGEDGLALLDLEHPEQGVRRILDGYGRGEAPLPVYKMPHLGGWGVIGDLLLLPAIGRHEVLLVDRRGWREAGRVAVQGQPVFVVARPGRSEVWVNFAHPANDVVEVIDVASRRVVRRLVPGKAVMHIEFTPDGKEAWVSARDSGAIVVYDADTGEPRARLAAESPSGVFMVSRGLKVGS